MSNHLLIALLATMCFFADFGEVSVTSAAEKPNVVMIISDDQAYGDFGFMGHAHIKTPHIDKLAQRSLVYKRGYVPDSLCRPSLMTMMTGQYPHRHKVVGNDPPQPAELRKIGRQGLMRNPKYIAAREEYLQHIDRAPKITEILGNEGYLSFQSGKWWEGSYQRGKFTHGMTHGDPTKGGRHGDLGLKIGREGMDPIYKFIDTAQKEDKPFFLWYAPFLPHTPHNPPARILNKYKTKTDSLGIAKYWAMCEWFDETVGQLVTHLDEQGLTDNTIIVFVTDNGWQQPHEKDLPKGKKRVSLFDLKGKRTQYEDGIRTPIMFSWPGHITPHMDDTRLASSIDLCPTILGLLNMPANEKMDGIDLCNPEAVKKRNQIFGTIFEHDPKSMTDPAPSVMYRWTIINNYKLVVPNKNRFPNGEIELYDLKADPREENNLAPSKPTAVTRIMPSLDTWWKPKIKNGN